MMRRYPTRDEIIQQEDDQNWTKEAAKEQPMSDTLPEREVQATMDHDCIDINNNPTGKDCTACRTEKQEHQTTVADYCDECKGRPHAPWCSEFELLETEANQLLPDGISSISAGDKPQSAARGGGGLWNIEGGSLVGRRRIRDATNYWIADASSNERADQIVTEHNQHQALVAALRQVPMLIEAARGVINAHSHRGRKGYQQALTQGVNELSAALLPLIAIQETIYTALNEQRSTSE